MNKLFKYILFCLFLLFVIYYLYKIYIISKRDNELLNQLYNYKYTYDYDCIEGKNINDKIILGKNGSFVNINESYSNMKGNTFNSDLIKYDTIYCANSIKSNKTILKGNIYDNNISIVIDIDNFDYFNDYLSLFDKYNSDINILIYNKDLLNNEYLNKYNVILKDSISTYCINNTSCDVSLYYEKSIEKNLFKNIKGAKYGDILYIKENKDNLNELNISLKYLNSVNINVVSIEKLLN